MKRLTAVAIDELKRCWPRVACRRQATLDSSIGRSPAPTRIAASGAPSAGYFDFLRSDRVITRVTPDGYGAAQ